MRIVDSQCRAIIADHDTGGDSGHDDGERGELRLHHRRRRFGGLRAGEPAVGRPGEPRARAGGRPARLQVGRLHPHAGRTDVPDRQPVLRLEVRVRARAAHERPPHLPRQGQGARRLEQHQRHDLPARQPARLRPLGGRSRHGQLGLRALPAVLQADGDLPGGRRRVPRRRRPARAGARPGRQPAVPRVLPGRAAGRLPADRRRQRLPAGGLRAVRPQPAPRPPAQCRPRLPAPGPAPAEPHRAHPRVRDERSGSTAAARPGVEYSPRRPARTRRAAGEIILCGGAINSPQLLQLSGIGSPDVLEQAGVQVQPRPARRRREPPGSPRGLRPVRLQAAGVGGRPRSSGGTGR